LEIFVAFAICRYLAFTTADVENGWYGGTLIYYRDENSGAYKHYSELCQVSVSMVWKKNKQSIYLSHQLASESSSLHIFMFVIL